MIDLPGLTYLKEEGVEYSEVIKSMIIEQVSDPNCLILMVSPASTDLGNSETVKLAREVDEEKTRTLCVITKADLAGEGFSNQVLENGLGLKLGTFIVRNRT